MLLLCLKYTQGDVFRVFAAISAAAIEVTISNRKPNGKPVKKPQDNKKHHAVIKEATYKGYKQYRPLL
jgi:hypothetical protein